MTLPAVVPKACNVVYGLLVIFGSAEVLYMVIVERSTTLPLWANLVTVPVMIVGILLGTIILTDTLVNTEESHT